MTQKKPAPDLVAEDAAVALRDFRRIPGVGRAVAGDLWSLGLRSVDDLRGRDPEVLYERLCELQGVRVDRCMLYVFRCAVYFASHEEHDPVLLRWWSWKDGGPAFAAGSR